MLNQAESLEIQGELIPTLPDDLKSPGPVESAFIKQIAALEKSGVMTESHAGIKALVLTAARAVDRISPRDAASGRSNLLRALDEISQRLPEPKSSEASAIDRLEALFNLDSKEPIEYDAAE